MSHEAVKYLREYAEKCRRKGNDVRYQRGRYEYLTAARTADILAGDIEAGLHLEDAQSD